jgi:interferon, gamma-inducible protein 30
MLAVYFRKVRPVKNVVLLVFIFILVLVYFSRRKHTPEGPPVQITALISSTCPDSVRFIKYQIYPVWKIDPAKITVNIIPFGKSKLSNEGGKVKITCQFGPEECEKNLFWACSMKKWPIEEWFPLINCLANEAWHPLLTAKEECSRKLKISPQKMFEVIQCTESQEGRELQENLANVTIRLAPKLRYVPHLFVNGVHDTDIQRKAEFSLKQLVI